MDIEQIKILKLLWNKTYNSIELNPFLAEHNLFGEVQFNLIISSPDKQDDNPKYKLSLVLADDSVLKVISLKSIINSMSLLGPEKQMALSNLNLKLKFTWSPQNNCQARQSV